jgi:hypothetical protein
LGAIVEVREADWDDWEQRLVPWFDGPFQTIQVNGINSSGILLVIPNDQIL